MNTNTNRIGKKITLYRDVERFPDFIARKGMTGTIVEERRTEGFVAVAMDKPLKGAEDWDNQIHWLRCEGQIFEADIYHNKTLANL